MSSTTNENPGCLSFFTRLFGGGQAGKPAAATATVPDALPYRVRDDLLSPTELSFYRVLKMVIGARASLFIKVGLADVFYVARPNENQSYRNRIAQKHVDFLVCDAQTLKPLFSVELDDASHQRADRQERDSFVDQVFQAANLPLIHIAAQREYNVHDLAAKFEAYLPSQPDTPSRMAAGSQPPKQVTPPIQDVAENSSAAISSAPICPKCGLPMVVRTVTQGEHKGKQFFGCVNFPRCREVKALKPSAAASPAKPSSP